MTKQFWAILAVIVVLLGGLYLLTGKSKAPSSSSPATASRHIEGKGTSGVTLQEYGDYQCPACGQYYAAIKQVEAQYQDKIFFQFSNLPLPQLHQNAFAAARAAEAAGLQGKYFEMHDLIYENQQVWSGSNDAFGIFTGFANRLGLNIDQFKKDYSSSKVNDTINADVDAFKKTGNQVSTPTFFIDGKKVDNTQMVDANGPSPAQIAKLLDAAITAKQKP